MQFCKINIYERNLSPNGAIKMVNIYKHVFEKVTQFRIFM